MAFSWFNTMVPASSPNFIVFYVSNGHERITVGHVDIFTGHISRFNEGLHPMVLAYGPKESPEDRADLAMVYAMALLAMAKCSRDHIKQARENGVSL